MTVIFDLEGERIKTEYDKSKLSLGSLVHVTRAKDGSPHFRTKITSGSLPYSVHWISPSNWYVELTDGWKPPEGMVKRIVKALGDLIEEDVVRAALDECRSDIPLEKTYLTEVYEKSRANQIAAVAERLHLVEALSDSMVAKALFAHFEALVIYLLLTCFDLLGQPAPWKDFSSWLDSPEPDRSALSGDDPIKQAKQLRAQWSAKYGARNSFYRFLNEVLPASVLAALLDSFDIIINTNPPDICTQMANNQQKKAFLYSMRNRYTHRALFIKGTHPDILDPIISNATKLRQEQYFGKRDWKTLVTKNWPDPIRAAVKRGLVCLIEQIANKGDQQNIASEH